MLFSTRRCKKRMYAAGIAVLTICLLLTFRNFVAENLKSDDHDRNLAFGAGSIRTEQLVANVANLTNMSVRSDIPIIVWWTPRLYLRPDLDLTECKNGHACYLSANRKHMSNPMTRGLIFYGTDIEPGDLPSPRVPHREWALFHEESPMNIQLLQHCRFFRLFNHTATFKRESDFPLTTQSIINLAYLVERKPVSIAEKNSYRKRGYAPVLYVQSHCNVASYRDIYVKELMKHLEVDSYGSCLNNKQFESTDLDDAVESMNAPKFLDLISRYKFHLAFENALCDDYMTEKLFRVIHVGSVPVYRGSPRAPDWMPDNKTIIMVDNFTTPLELANYIKYLDANDDEYESYLNYRKPKGITNQFLRQQIHDREWGCNDLYMPNFIEAFECHVCEKISERYKHETARRSDPSLEPLPPKIAHVDQMRCPVPHKPFGILDDNKNNDRNEIDWKEDFWSGMDRAKAVDRMLKDGVSGSDTFMKYWDDVVREINRD
ncbi:GDP-fucose protein O-fucosyltransferase 4-like [Tubulanus polymorphus]|uniref:GDP-fucose protein O-fucosyltransferase 4-like n=1 Tax=Tubulanus polymorphus TaxID=672921 RepID=UPI003DA21B6F